MYGTMNSRHAKVYGIKLLFLLSNCTIIYYIYLFIYLFIYIYIYILTILDARQNSITDARCSLPRWSRI